MLLKALTDTYIKVNIKDSSLLSNREKLFISKDSIIEVLSIKEIENHFKIEIFTYTFYIFIEDWKILEHTAPNKEDIFLLTEEQLKYIIPNASIEDINLYLEPLNKVCNTFDISTSKRLACFIAQIAHESGSLKYKEEIASGEAYEGRKDLGNLNPGDGVKYKGRGLIQLTGRYNYQQAGIDLDLDLENNPELVVSDPYINTLVAGWFWNKNDLNSLADINDFLSITRRINGGLNGLTDREAYWERAKEILQVKNNTKNHIYTTDINWDNFSTKVGKYFTVREVTNGSKKRIPTDINIKNNIINLVIELDQLREEWGEPILVNSWYRPPIINAEVGGVPNSQHINGSAVDIRPSNGKINEFQSWLDSKWYGALGYGAKKGFVHIDMRNDKGYITGGSKGPRWNY